MPTVIKMLSTSVFTEGSTAHLEIADCNLEGIPALLSEQVLHASNPIRAVQVSVREPWNRNEGEAFRVLLRSVFGTELPNVNLARAAL